MLALVPTAFLPLTLAVVFSSAPPRQNFVNTAIARTVELGGATTQVTTQYNVRALVDDPGMYHLALVGDGDEEPAWWEVSKGGNAVDAQVSTIG